MTRTSKIRWIIFLQSLLVLGLVSGAMFGVHRLALVEGWPLYVPVLSVLGLCLFFAALFTWKFSHDSNKLALAIESELLSHAELVARDLRGSVYEEPATAWQNALRKLQDSIFEKQSEAEQHRATLAELMHMVAKAVDERTSYLRGHSGRVAGYSAQIATELGIEPAKVERIRLAALLHDIGTVGIEDAIVRKDTPLTPEEFDIVKAHTVKGAAILRPIEALKDLIPGVELHHESLDGQGYPYGLRGDEIPMMARVIAVADSFDAMTTARPYQAAMDPAYVLEVLKRLADKRYDPNAVDALIELVRRGEIVAKNPRQPLSFPQRRVLSEVV
ncbi:HD-GYP domain-containing protein [Silvibacterium acidisoli]|uniref:HD-GYP domain-containing protein n=1 Tax=Acidobacteriaceae bacterium ZG23-2 TaxID=2883246 RepID=UPI00406C5979